VRHRRRAQVQHFGHLFYGQRLVSKQPDNFQTVGIGQGFKDL
jgi:hypothetical protein